MSSAANFEPVFLSLDDVLTIHARMIELYGGASGVRVNGMLELCLRNPAPRSGASSSTKTSSRWLQHTFSTSLYHGHPFFDGNKRGSRGGAGVPRSKRDSDPMHEIELADMVLEMIERHCDKKWVATH